MKSQGRQLFIAIVCADLLIVIAILVIRMNNSRISNNNLVQDTSVPEITPGMMVSGSVRNSNGMGVENIAIYAKYSSNPDNLIATTDAAGNYHSAFYAIPGVQMVTVWVEQSGLLFQPETYSWRHFAGYEIKRFDFLAQPGRKIYFPIISNAYK
jgi:hypothetical protein